MNREQFNLHYWIRPSGNQTILCLHGLGCNKNDFLPLIQSPQLDHFTLVALDFPGFGHSSYPEKLSLNMDVLAQITRLFVQTLNLHDFILLGHSMSGLVGILYLEYPDHNACGFINVEGNLNADDCFFSREVIKHSYKNFLLSGFNEIKEKVRTNSNKGFQDYAISLEQTNPRAYFDCCPSMVEYSTHGHLINRFTKLALPKIFIYGSENKHLAYLDDLRSNGLDLIEIPNSNHWPLGDNPESFCHGIKKFSHSLYNNPKTIPDD